MNLPPANSSDADKPECDHEWKFVDDSFDHEFGRERIHYMRCEKCDATKDCERNSGPIAGEDYDIP